MPVVVSFARAPIPEFEIQRQVPIGPYVVDFICFDHKLIVEVDGGQYSESAADHKRDEWLLDEGYRVLRFWNSDVLKNTNAVLEQIAEAITPAATPLPAREACHRAGANAPDPLARHPLPQEEREGYPRDRN